MGKLCTKCGTERPIEQFGRHPAMRDGHLNHCKPCVAARQKRLYERQREARIAKARASYQANRDEILIAGRVRYKHDTAYRAAKLARNKVRKSYSPKSKVRLAVHRQEHPEMHRLYGQSKRSRDNGVPDGLSIGEWQAMIGRVHGCAYCGSHEAVTLDHVVPLSRGGDHEIGNVVPCCRRCNASKFNLTFVEWMASTRPRVAKVLAFLTERPIGQVA
jgi:5-methylcytosine-specific restriction endonuclease McrA